MNKPHKHAAVIKAWADGAAIQMRGAKRESDPLGQQWRDCDPPLWHPTMDYRVKHRWVHIEDAAREGKTIQFRRASGTRAPSLASYVVPEEWTDFTSRVEDAGFTGDLYEWRVKPEHQWTAVEDAWKAGKAIQFRDNRALQNAWHDFSSTKPRFGYVDWVEWRVKPSTLRLRVGMSREGFPVTVFDQERHDKLQSNRLFFNRWLTDWIEIEVKS